MRHSPPAVAPHLLFYTNATLSASEYIVHGVQAGGFSGQELGRVERAAGESVAIECAVAQFEGFARQGKDHGMLAGRIGDPQGVDADLGIGRLCAAPPARGRRKALPGELGQAKGRAAGSIFLGAMMPFDDRDVGGLRPSARAASPTSLISRLTARLMLGAIRIGILVAAALELGALGRVEAGRADDQGNLALRHSARDRRASPAAARSRS